MLKEYNKLLKIASEKDAKYKELLDKVQAQKNECANFKRSIDLKNHEYEKSLQLEVDKMLQQELREVESEFQRYKMSLASYEEEVSKEAGRIKHGLDTNEFISQNSFNTQFSELEKMCIVIKESFEQYVPEETINLYTKLSYTISFKNNELQKITEWLKYFDNYDEYDSLISKAESIEAKINLKEDSQFMVVAILALIVGLMAIKVVILPIYFGFILATLYIRCKEYFYLIKLLSVFNLINTKKENITEQFNTAVSQFASGEVIKLSAIQAEYDMQFGEIKEALAFLEDKEKNDVKKRFNYDEAREVAKHNLARDDAAIATRLADGEKLLETMEQSLSAIADERAEVKEQLTELRNKIVKSYEDLDPTFEETNLLSEFFLGFDKTTGEPVTFEYGGYPSVIFFQGTDNTSYEAVIKTITMMCSQIMCIMSPTSYKINVVDTRTAGSQLSAFQVTSTKEDSAESQLFKVITTSQEASKHVKALYDLFEARRIKILGNYRDIEDYNKQKVAKEAKPESFSINFFLHFDYKLLNQTEELKILCRIAKLIGIALIFVIDTEQVGKDDKSIKGADLLKFLELFRQTNLFGFNISENSVEIVKKPLYEIKKMFAK